MKSENKPLTQAARKGSGLPERNVAEPDPDAQKALDLILKILNDPGLRKRIGDEAQAALGRTRNGEGEDREFDAALVTATTKLLKRGLELNKTLHRAVPDDGLV